jgi:hypothetical protein
MDLHFFWEHKLHYSREIITIRLQAALQEATGETKHETHMYLHSNIDMYMWNQVNCTQNYYTNIGTNAPYNQWSYLMVSCPHH